MERQRRQFVRVHGNRFRCQDAVAGIGDTTTVLIVLTRFTSDLQCIPLIEILLQSRDGFRAEVENLPFDLLVPLASCPVQSEWEVFVRLDLSRIFASFFESCLVQFG